MISEDLNNSYTWCRREFVKIELGDKRLNRRFILTAERLLARPESSVNQACMNWAEKRLPTDFLIMIN